MKHMKNSIEQFPFTSYDPITDPRDLLSSEINQNLRIGVPKGRLRTYAHNLLRESGWGPYLATVTSENQYTVKANYGNRLFYLRNDDIISEVQDGTLNYGFVGADYIWEAQLSGRDITPRYQVGGGECQMYLGFLDSAPQFSSSQEITDWLNDGLIATSYPRVAQRLLSEYGVQVNEDQFKVRNGSIEAYLELNPQVQAVVDITQTGNTARANGINQRIPLITFPGTYLFTSSSTK